ncbi:MAG: Sugar transporter SemiSWEET [Turneriella sp.]|nr:Sugar transporter SemiSWEET [Turneriella sp.]
MDYLGFVAGVLTTFSFVPQVIRIYQTKSGRDISFWMMFLFSVGVSLWLFYGILLRSAPIIFSNAVTLMLVLIIIVMKLFYKSR